MPLRDKLAQLLMVGVQNAADARAVVTDNHVGGIFIGSWTDLSMLTDGSIPDIAAAAGPLALAVSVDEEGGRVQRLSSLIGSQPSPRVLAQTKTPDEVYQIALQRGQAMRGLGITVDFAPVVDVTADADDTVIGDRSFGSDPAAVTRVRRRLRTRTARRGPVAGAQALPGPRPRLGRLAHRRCRDPAAGGAAGQRPDPVPHAGRARRPVAVMVGHLQVPGLTGSDPASLSPAAYDLLRSGGYGGPPFGGPVFTDDLSRMAAINRPIRGRRGGAAGVAGRRRRRAVGDHRRGARGAGPARAGGQCRRTAACSGSTTPSPRVAGYKGLNPHC